MSAPRIKELGSVFRRRGFDFCEIHRSSDGKVRLYQQILNGRLAGYVVAKIKHSSPPEEWESEFDEHEVFPSPEQFGLTAWQYEADQLELAHLRMDLVASRKAVAS